MASAAVLALLASAAHARHFSAGRQLQQSVGSSSEGRSCNTEVASPLQIAAAIAALPGTMPQVVCLAQGSSGCARQHSPQCMLCIAACTCAHFLLEAGTPPRAMGHQPHAPQRNIRCCVQHHSATSVAACRALSSSSAANIRLRPRQHVTIECSSLEINYSVLSAGLSFGQGSALELRNCKITNFNNFQTRGGDAALLLRQSTIRLSSNCEVRTAATSTH
jgi:hypothetical protein